VRRDVLVAVGALSIMAVVPSNAQEPLGGVVRQTSAGPCNMITVNVNAEDLQRGIFDGFAVAESGQIGTLTVKEIDTYFTVRLSTGDLVCTSSDSTSRVSDAGEPVSSARWARRRARVVHVHRAGTRVVVKVEPAR
jgi:hypothetical protein